METVLNLAIGKFSLSGGEVEVERRGTVPFEIHGRQLAARLVYDRAGPRYRGEVSVQPLDVRWNKGDEPRWTSARLSLSRRTASAWKP